MTTRFLPLTPRIGAKAVMRRDEILAPGFRDECLDALERHGVLLFPQIGLSDEEQVAFSRNLGDVVPQGPKRADGTQEVVFKITLDPRVNPSAEYLKATIDWHIDGLFEDGPPPKATMLSARRLSATGGQTEFCNTYAAYDDLPAAERQRCESLSIVHSLEASNRATNPDPTPEERARWREAEAHRRRAGRIGVKEHPLVWRHRSGRKSLVLGMSVDHVAGMPESEGHALIESLTAHATRRENVYRHEWQIGDLLIWDNCGVMHRAIPYDPDSGRLMHRTVLHGVETITGVERTE
ncbi:MAG TPA: TauD/TfdA family dioxygenase [Candidatus Dormibacteraeota bacterium]|nr:TauD/TfdA family dioxygenase [Candidatus Dormibacteraeota bacterium]